MTTFQEAVNEVSSIADAFKPGLQALRARDRARVDARDPRRLRGSVDLDGALRAARPTENRWDHSIGMRFDRGERPIFVEVHPASTSDVEAMLDKIAWLKAWLRDEGTALRDLGGPAEYRWVASGKVAIRPGTPQARRLAHSGLTLPVSRLTV